MERISMEYNGTFYHQELTHRIQKIILLYYIKPHYVRYYSLTFSQRYCEALANVYLRKYLGTAAALPVILTARMSLDFPRNTQSFKNLAPKKKF